MALKMPYLLYSSLLIKGITRIILNKKGKMLKVKLMYENNKVSLTCLWIRWGILGTGTYWCWVLVPSLILLFEVFCILPNWGLVFLGLDLWWLVKPFIGPCLKDWIFSTSPFDCGTLSSSHGIEPSFELHPPWPRVSNPKWVSILHRCCSCHNMFVWGLTS